jgi:hypothetical protein
MLVIAMILTSCEKDANNTNYTVTLIIDKPDIFHYLRDTQLNLNSVLDGFILVDYLSRH